MSDAIDVAASLRAATHRLGVATDAAVRALRTIEQRVHESAVLAAVTEGRIPANVDVEAAVERVRAAIAANDPAAIRGRDARFAIRRFEMLSPREGGKLLSFMPTLWPRWVRRFFAERMNLSSPIEALWAALLKSAPDDILLLGDTLNREALLLHGAERSARALSEIVPSVIGLKGVLLAVTADGLLDARWRYTATMLAHCATDPNRSLAETWQAVNADPVLDAMLLPMPARVATDVPRPAVDSSVEVQALLAVALIVGELDGTTKLADTAWRTRYFESAFKDPRESADARENPESDGWRAVKRFAPAAYDAFISSLFGEDLSLFFSQVEMDAARRAFWKRYIGVTTASTFFLTYATRTALEARFRGADDKVRAALRRARPLTRQGSDAFALRFGPVVVVEFAEMGNAAYLYTADAFEKVARGRNLTTADLKRKDLGGNSLIHTTGWQAAFKARLASLGIQK